ncbi:nicotinic acetylcholine receptor alpha 6 precursor variant, partial [Danaus plexippus plexippus]
MSVYCWSFKPDS